MDRRRGERPRRTAGDRRDWPVEPRTLRSWGPRFWTSRRLHGTDVWRAFIRDAHAAEIEYTCAGLFPTQASRCLSGAPRTRTWNRRFWRPVPFKLAYPESERYSGPNPGTVSGDARVRF